MPELVGVVCAVLCTFSSSGGCVGAGRAAWENAKDATVDSGRYLAGRASDVVNGDGRDGRDGRSSGGM